MMILLDNTVLSNFALVGRIDLLREALGDSVATTPQVINEFNRGIAIGRLPATSLDWLETINLVTAEEGFFQEFLAHVNAGEAACLAVALRRNGRFLTDDRDAHKLAAQLQVPVSGMLGVLAHLVQLGVLTPPVANEILGLMIASGYRSPVEELEDL